MKILRHGLVLLGGALCLTGIAGAKPWWMRDAASDQTNFLPPDQAFRVSARIEGGLIRVRWVIADGYYLYRQKMDVTGESPDLVVSPPTFPRGTTKADPYLGTQEIFTQQVEGTAAFTRSDGGAHPVEIKLSYQGCAEAGLCYPPISKVIFPTSGAPSGVGATGTVGAAGTVGAPGSMGAPGALGISRATGVGAAAQRWEGYAILGGGFAFFLAGLLLRKSRRLALP